MKHRTKKCQEVYDIGSGSRNSIGAIAEMLGDKLSKTVRLVSEVYSDILTTCTHFFLCPCNKKVVAQSKKMILVT